MRGALERIVKGSTDSWAVAVARYALIDEPKEKT